jgi:hypothetical protein
MDDVDPEELAVSCAGRHVQVARNSERSGSLTTHLTVTYRAGDGIRRPLLGNGSSVLLCDGMGGRLLAVNGVDGTQEAMELNQGWTETITGGRRQFEQLRLGVLWPRSLGPLSRRADCEVAS